MNEGRKEGGSIGRWTGRSVPFPVFLIHWSRASVPWDTLPSCVPPHHPPPPPQPTHPQRGQRLPERAVWRYFHQVCEALRHLHARRPALLHRDLKVRPHARGAFAFFPPAPPLPPFISFLLLT